MPIKAQRVDALQAQAVAKGFSSAEDKRRKKTEMNYSHDKANDYSESNSSASSDGSEFSATDPYQPTRQLTEGTDSSFDSDSDKEALAEARRRTAAFLYPKRERNVKPHVYVDKPVSDYAEAKHRKSQAEQHHYRHQPPVDTESEPSPSLDLRPPAEPQHRPVVEPPITVKKAEAQEAIPAPLPPSSATHGDDPKPRELYRREAHTFAELQEDALHELYEREDASGSAFVALDHMREAYTMAASKIVSNRSSANPQPARRMMDGAFSMEEVAAIHTAQRNATFPSGNASSPGESAGVHSAGSLAASTQLKLDRFFEAVRWLEKLVVDERFMAHVANFLELHHKKFMNHALEKGSTVESYTHDEFNAYNQFSTEVSEMVFKVLSTKVDHFDEQEFAEALFDTPVECRMNPDQPMNVVAYPAWRIMMAISNFQSFTDWMVEYIHEEFHLDEEDRIVAGTRGLKALMASTYHRHNRGGIAAPQPEADTYGEDNVPPLPASGNAMGRESASLSVKADGVSIAPTKETLPNKLRKPAPQQPAVEDSVARHHEVPRHTVSTPNGKGFVEPITPHTPTNPHPSSAPHPSATDRLKPPGDSKGRETKTKRRSVSRGPEARVGSKKPLPKGKRR